MTTYLDLDKCQLLCSCKRTHPLFRLYFCRYCSVLRCSDCVSHEVDSYFCSNCLENMPSAEAKMRKHCCCNCYDCPMCGNTLSTRATAVVVAKPDEPGRTTAQKAYYMVCGFCRWSTRDSGIEDKPQAAMNWQQNTDQHLKRISELITAYNDMAVREKSDNEWNRYMRKRNYIGILDHYPTLNNRLRRLNSSWNVGGRDRTSDKKVEIPPSEATADLPAFELDQFIDQPLQLDKITRLDQRHLSVNNQPIYMQNLQPKAKTLVIKRSMRCRVCEHNLSKSDFSPVSIKFRINLNAYYHIPEIRFTPVPMPKDPTSIHSSSQPRRTSQNITELKNQPIIHPNVLPGQTFNVILTLYNPAHRITTVKLRQLTLEEEREHLGHLIELSQSSSIAIEDEDKNENKKDENIECRYSTVNLTIPDIDFKLAPRNDLIDYEENANQNIVGDVKDDPSIIAFRRGHKLGILVGITPHHPEKSGHMDTICEGDESSQPIKPESKLRPLRAAMKMSFDYKNVLLTESRNTTESANSVQTADKEGKGGEAQTKKEPVSSVSQTTSEINQIELIVLMDFGCIKS